MDLIISNVNTKNNKLNKLQLYIYFGYIKMIIPGNIYVEWRNVPHSSSLMNAQSQVIFLKHTSFVEFKVYKQLSY